MAPYGACEVEETKVRSSLVTPKKTFESTMSTAHAKALFEEEQRLRGKDK